jgi:tetratricopeptide (TPR) repeat protein
VAYGSQLGARRAAVHAAVAQAIAEQYPERLDERAALLAQHWQAGGEALEAARWHARAAGWSGTNDPRQALHHWYQVRELAGALPNSEETAGLGLTARIFLLNYGWRLGISHEDAEALFTEAERMAAQAGDIRSRAILLTAYGVVRGLSDGDVREFFQLGSAAMALAEESGDPALYMTIVNNAYAFFLTGRGPDGLVILDRALELADGDVTVGAGIGVGCPYAFCLAIKGLFLIYLGRLEEARQLLDQGMKLAREQADMETVGWAHMWHVALAYVSGHPEPALGHAQQSLEIAERMGDSFSRAWAWTQLGIAHRLRGEWREAVEALERARALASERRAAVEGDAFRLAWLSESYLGLGDPERARALAEEGIARARERGNPGNERDASLALARVLLGSSGPAARAEIEAALARALELARATGAHIYEPLIHVELAELARQTGDHRRHEQELREAHRLFTEIGATGHAERLAAEPAMATH